MKQFLVALAMMVAGVMGLGVAMPVMAAEQVDLKEKCEQISDPELKAAWGCGNNEGVQTTAVRVINVVIGLIALVAVAVIVMAGQRFLAAAGDPGKVKQAKDMVLYAVIGLVVAMLAWIIVNFVVTGVQK